MKQIKKLFTLLVIMTVSLNLLSTTVFAGEYVTSTYIDSQAMTASEWWSGYDAHITPVTAYYKDPEVYDSQVGIWFYTPDYGVGDHFYRSNERVASVQLKEDDAGSNENELIRTYICTFGTDDNNRYRPMYFKNTGSSVVLIEDNPTVELYIRVKVNEHISDYGDYVRSGIMCYKYWVNS